MPIGVTIKEVVYDIGGGIPKGRKFKAVQMGGPSGGCVSAQYMNLPIDYNTLQAGRVNHGFGWHGCHG